MANPIIEVSGINKRFWPPFDFNKLARLDFSRPQPCVALKGVSFTVQKGTVLGILGLNGAGKTTLLKIISTLILPETGTVSVNGWSLGTHDERIKASVGLVTSSERSFYWRLTGRQNLEFFAAMYGLDGPDAKARIKTLFGLFAIDYQDKRFDSYSTGMQQKFGLMRAMLHDPAILLLDEPTKSLDYTTACDLRYFIKEQLVKKQKKTVIFTTHQMEEAMDLASIFMILHRGRVVAVGTLEELRGAIKNPSAALGEIFVQLTSGS
jgi:ABC-2 type transport system ATP-binding protein